MKRLLHIILIICAFNINVNGSNKNVKQQTCLNLSKKSISYGVEWGYIATVHRITRANFFNIEGSRENIKESRFGLWSNAEVLLHLGYNLSDCWNLSIYSGVTGLTDLHYAVPISLRATYYLTPNTMMDRWLVYADIGSGVSLKKEPQEILTGKIGGGYRINLSQRTKLDFIASLRLSYTHHQIIDGNDLVPLQQTNRNSALMESISLGMSITF